MQVATTYDSERHTCKAGVGHDEKLIEVRRAGIGGERGSSDVHRAELFASAGSVQMELHVDITASCCHCLTFSRNLSVTLHRHHVTVGWCSDRYYNRVKCDARGPSLK